MSIVKKVNESVLGHPVISIEIGDGGVVTKMKKKKKMIIRYVSSEHKYSPQQIEQYQEKEDALFNYILNQLLFQEASQN